MRGQKVGWLYIALAIPVVLGLFLLAASATITISSTACGTACHRVNPAYQSWNRSDHSDVPCYSCHVGDSPVSWFRQILVDLPQHALETISTSPNRPINRHSLAAPTITNDRCLNCHRGIGRSRATSRTRRYRQRHGEHTKAGVRCTDCHNRVAHETATKYSPLRHTAPGFRYRDYMEMSGCWRCHSTSPKTRDDGLLDELGLSSFPSTECRACHQGRRKPATGRLNHTGVLEGKWLDTRHGREARRDFDACLPCHPRSSTQSGQLSDCTQCHNGITMPHNIGVYEQSYSPGAPKWARQHATFSDSEDKCNPCHARGGSGSLCSQCHHKAYIESVASTDTPWPASHVGAKGDSQESCRTCHMVEFCAYCHINREKPPPNMYLYRLRNQ